MQSSQFVSNLPKSQIESFMSCHVHVMMGIAV